MTPAQATTELPLGHPLATVRAGCSDRGAKPALGLRQATALPRVRLAGRLTALEAPGGGEVQLEALARGLAEQGLDARPWRPWSDDWQSFDVLHLVGSAPEMIPLAEAARRQGIRVVVSPVAWFSWRSAWGEARSAAVRLRALSGLALRHAFPRLGTWRDRLYHLADRLLPNSWAEARQLERLFRVPVERIRVVPNGADPRLALARPEAFTAQYLPRGFVLLAGRIEPRKNQLAVLRALHGSGHRTVVLGDAVPGHAAYARACREAADADTLFLPRLAPRDPRLAGALAAAGCLALVSWFETPGLVALEAGLCGTPLVLTPHGATREYFGRHAQYAAPNDLAGIRRAVETQLGRGRDPELAAHVRAYFTWPQVALATREAYASL